MSTSTSPDFSKKWAGGLVFRVNAKKGMKGAAISPHPDDGEHEILFQQGHHMVVTAYDPKTRTMDVDLVEGNPHEQQKQEAA